MKALKITVIALVILVILAVVVGLLLPSTVHVERSTVINAPPATIFALVNGFAMFNRWSPWFELDPEASFSYEGSAFGPGAKMSWVSENPYVGTGSREITAANPFERVDIHNDFGENGSAETAFVIESIDTGTRVTWTSDTELGRGLIERYQGLMLDTWVGKNYERGLEKLTEIAQSLPSADWSTMDITVDERDAIAILFVSGQAENDPAGIGEALGEAYGAVASVMRKRGLEQTGAPLAIARSWGETGFIFDAGIPFSGDITEAQLENSPVQRGATPPGRVIQAVHVGPHDRISESYEKVIAFMGAHGFEPSSDPWESYISDPEVTPREELITVISYPVRDPVFN